MKLQMGNVTKKIMILGLLCSASTMIIASQESYIYALNDVITHRFLLFRKDKDADRTMIHADKIAMNTLQFGNYSQGKKKGFFVSKANLSVALSRFTILNYVYRKLLAQEVGVNVMQVIAVTKEEATKYFPSLGDKALKKCLASSYMKVKQPIHNLQTLEKSEEGMIYRYGFTLDEGDISEVKIKFWGSLLFVTLLTILGIFMGIEIFGTKKESPKTSSPPSSHTPYFEKNDSQHQVNLTGIFMP